MSERIVIETFEKLVLEYSVMKYKEEEHVFVTDIRNQDLVSDKFDEFVEKVFNSEGHSFHEYVINCDVTLTAEEILILLNFNNRTECGNGIRKRVELDLTEEKIVNLFGYFCVKEKCDDVLWEIRNGDDDDDEEEEEEKA
jgi:hypothetical protein